MPNPPETKSARPLSLLSVVIPARDEEGCIASTIEHLHLELSLHGVPHEIIVVDDGSSDSTWQILQGEAAKIPALRPVQNPGPHGFGRAITKGLDSMAGDAVVIMMADESDDCRDVVRYWHALNEGHDCVFGSRFLKHGGVIDYPPLKLALNRAANAFIRLLFRHGLNDTTNAFKAYRRTGTANPKLREMGSRYLFICLYVWLEKYFPLWYDLIVWRSYKQTALRICHSKLN
jgi:dolichol-phosphate mannosyltransferase